MLYQDEDIKTFYTLCVLIVGFIITVYIRYLSGIFEDMRYVKGEMRDSRSREGFMHWKKELHILHISLIPFLTPNIVRSLLRLFKKGKHCSREINNGDKIFSAMLPSFLGIAICAICLTGSTFAWFTASQSTALTSIKSANYQIIPTVKNDKGEIVLAEDGAYQLESGVYTVTLDASGSATTGYAVVNLNGTDFFTEQFYVNENNDIEFEFTLTANELSELKIFAQWGEYDEADKNILKNTEACIIPNI